MLSAQRRNQLALPAQEIDLMFSIMLIVWISFLGLNVKKKVDQKVMGMDIDSLAIEEK